MNVVDAAGCGPPAAMADEPPAVVAAASRSTASVPRSNPLIPVMDSPFADGGEQTPFPERTASTPSEIGDFRSLSPVPKGSLRAQIHRAGTGAIQPKRRL